MLPTPTAQLNEPAPWKDGVDWWLQSRATRNLEGVVTGNTPLLPSPVERDWKGVPGKNVQMASLPREVSLLPTPRALGGRGEGAGSWLERNRKLAAERPKGASGIPLDTLVQLLPDEAARWGRYERAVRGWELVLGRPAPEPSVPGRSGPRLNPKLPEWMMGLPAGWVTQVPGLTRKQQLQVLGNGVVRQQGAMALRLLLDDMKERNGNGQPGNRGDRQESPAGAG